jgi:chaperone BCS1
MDDLEVFYANAERYTSLEIPYTRTYMFHGLPGTGKTSMIYTIASEMNKNLAVIDFSDRDISDSSIRRAMYKIPKDTILCLEDIDSLFSADRKSDKSTVTFSGILNILDGVLKNTGIVIFMTTNLLSTMDDTAMRRRVDYYLKFDVMKKEQVTLMFQKFYPDQDYKKFLKAVGKTVFTPCILQKFFVRHLDSSDITEHVDELIHMCTNEYKLTNTSDALYT